MLPQYVFLYPLPVAVFTVLGGRGGKACIFLKILNTCNSGCESSLCGSGYNICNFDADIGKLRGGEIFFKISLRCLRKFASVSGDWMFFTILILSYFLNTSVNILASTSWSSF
jgi:hypothetical protein